MTDYLMVFALILLVAGLSLPTIMQLSGLLRQGTSSSDRSPASVR